MPAFGSHHMANPRDVPYSGEIGAAGDSSENESFCDLDLESGGVLPVKLHSGGKKKKRRNKKSKDERYCRICHLALEDNNGGSEEEDEEEEEEEVEADDDDDDDDEVEDDDDDDDDDEEEFYGLPLELGCSCKGDLGIAHRKCAESWFKIKGNLTCEICGAMALNVANEGNNNRMTSTTTTTESSTHLIQTESQGFCHGRRLINLLLAALIFTFIVSWLFHFKVLR